MAASALLTGPGGSIPGHSAAVRFTHWLTALSFFGLLISGIAILLAHPRLYWGETGAVGMPSLLDLPLPFVLTGQSGWGRSLHFLAAWVSVITGLLYVLAGVFTRHFREHLVPAKRDLAWDSLTRVVSNHVRLRMRDNVGYDGCYDSGYNVLQRIAYLGVVFVLFPMMIWTGLATSPAIASVFPALVTVLGGQQSARTLHFFVANGLVLFLLVHIAMICLTGFRRQMRAMIVGHRV